MIIMPYYSVNEMRRMISSVYDSPKWREKVRCMPDGQVKAIYYSFLESGKFEEKEKKKKESVGGTCSKKSDENSYYQLTFEDIFGSLV